ncbi:dihydrofolate reductase [Demequina sp. NBRC 110053]|uniref:dihydrofolate reductase n=1 Tax=Demequina sp. NBRC 110053 TaxID=1570342 RepID=UPI000A0462A3|nr:dihydrofolate reductase [Demequina sp. NBRC 110053]
MLKAIWAQARDGFGRPVIGSAGDMPWHLPEDLAHFKELTTGAPVIMGRRTWESFPARFRPLPGRVNVVITTGGAIDGADAVVGSLDEALVAAARLAEGRDAWVIGGGRVYAEAMERLDLLEVTEIDLEVDGDTFAPAIDGAAWEPTEEGEWATSRTGTRYRFLTYARR